MNNVKIKKFLGMEVRIVNEEYIVLKDVFRALGRLDNKNQIVSTDRNKLKEFLIDINKLCDSKTFTITSKSKKSKSRDYQEVDCLNISIIPDPDLDNYIADVIEDGFFDSKNNCVISHAKVTVFKV